MIHRRTYPRLSACLLVAAVGSVAVPTAAAPDTTAWQLLDDGDPSPYSDRGVFFEPWQRPVLVQSGLGIVGTLEGPVTQWELVGEDWQRRWYPEPTPHKIRGCMAYDAARERIVLFGEGADQDRTWEFDGTTWVERVLAVHPPGRSSCAMVYDADNARIVMFGGYPPTAPPNVLGDTWEYDGTSWQEISATGPRPRAECGMAYDAGRGVTVLMGGRDGNLLFGDVWEYDARRERWRDRTTASGPSVRGGPGLVYDPVRDRTVLFGGLTYGAFLNDTWEWDGRVWQQQSPGESPSPRSNVVTLYDASRGAVLLFGGRQDYAGVNDTWTYDGTTWTRIAVSGLPEGRDSFALAYSPERDAVVLYGGRDNVGIPLQDTWIYANGTWTQQSPPNPPSSFAHFHLARNPTTTELEGFGGVDMSGWPQEADDHAYDPAADLWTSTPACCPDPRVDPGWTWSESLGGMLMFGGQACCFVSSLYYANDTWLKTPSGWTELSPQHAPVGRGATSLAWDSSRHRGVAYGGHTDIKSLSDTWEFDGVDWVQRFASSPPGARYSIGLVYDPVRQVTVLFGAGNPMEQVTWEYDGTSWIAKPTPFLPDPSRAYLQLAYDSKREVVFLFGGEDLKSVYNFTDTWVYGADPDEDGIVGKLDNCTQVANPDQANADGDPAGDACDCAAADPGSFAPPAEVSGLSLEGAGTTSLTWADQSGAVGSAVVYDVATGLLSDLRSSGYAGATCLNSGLTTPSASDGRVPVTGDGYWHLVRSRNACGTGSYGPGRAALDAAAPCP